MLDRDDHRGGSLLTFLVVRLPFVRAGASRPNNE